MLNNENNTDRLFRDKLLNHEVVPPPGVWDNIVKGMEAENRRKRMIWILGLSSAASLLLAFLAGWYVAVKQPAEKNLQANALQLETNLHSQVKTQVLSSISSTQNINLQDDNYLFKSAEKIKSTKNNASISEKIQHENILIKLLSPLESFFLATEERPAKLIAMNSDHFSDSDRAIIARNIDHKKEALRIEKHSNWAVGVEASPVYRFQQTPRADNQESDPLLSLGSTDGSSSYVTNITGGIKVELNTSSRLSVQSGVNYGEIAQNPGEVGISFSGHNWVTDQLGTEETKGFISNPNDGNSLSNNMILKTQMGLANLKMPEGVGLATVNVTNNYTSEVARNYNLEQKAGYLEIPLIIRYKIIDRRMDFLLLGGVNTNVLMSNNVTLVDKKEVIANGKIEGLNPLTFSSSVGMGVNYAITDRFNLSIEPTMKIQLNSLNKQSGYDSRPYTVGIFTGISYQF
jgi:hypothetical protein